MSRYEELMSMTGNDPLLKPTILEMVHLEEELETLRQLPKLRVHPKDPTRQKPTTAAKLYKEYLQQYTNIVRILMKATGTGEQEDRQYPHILFRCPVPES